MQERKDMRASRNSTTSMTPTTPRSPITTTDIIPPPTPQIDVKLNTSSSDKSDHDSASIDTTPTTRSRERDFTYMDDAGSLRTEGKGSEVAAGNEKQAYGINRDEGSSKISKAQSVTSTTESNI